MLIAQRLVVVVWVFVGLAMAMRPGELAGQETADERLAAVVAALEAEEAKFRDIEYWAQITTRKLDPKVGGDGEIVSEEKRHVVLQGERIHFRQNVLRHMAGKQVEREEISAFDGNETRTVVTGNSANVHVGRFEHPDVYPAHTLPLVHYSVNFPLSVFLRGTDAIHAHPKYGLFAWPTGFPAQFDRVVARREGEEQLDGLKCVKLRCERWYHPEDQATQFLWLCPERNYQCVKEQLFRIPFGELPVHEMHVERLEEVKPGVWLPAKMMVQLYDWEALRANKQVLALRTETIVEKVDLAPRHDDLFFRDVLVTPDLPLFTIKTGTLVGSWLAEPVGGELEAKKLKEVVARVHEEEERYTELRVEARNRYRHLHTDDFPPNLITEISKEEQSVLHGKLGYFSSLGNHESSGERSVQGEVRSFDGEWTRGFGQTLRPGKEPQRWALLKKGGGGKAEGRHDGIAVFRPHTFLVRDNWFFGPLADLLVSPWYDKANNYRLRFRYCGEDEFDGHPCVKLRDEFIPREGQPPTGFTVYWLATDRNYIPIKTETYGGNFGLTPLPTGMCFCDDLREIAPGVWYPMHTKHFAFHYLAKMQRRLVLSWRRDYEVAAVELKPQVDEALFRQVTAPAGTRVTVMDEEGRRLGTYPQENDGPIEISAEQYQAMQKEAAAREAARQKEK